MYTLKSILKRGSLLGAAGAMLVAAILPASAAFADSLNPLTERSLLLSSSAPGYQNTDGSGNPDYAPPGSGPNGQKSGETFTFKVSSTATINAFTFQYCTGAAGNCKAPGNNAGDADPDNDGNAVGTDSTRASNATSHPLNKSDLDVVLASPVAGTDYEVWVNGVNVSSTGAWNLSAVNLEDTAHLEPTTGKNNFIRLTNTTGVAAGAGQQVRIVFKASATNYITNPGDDSFFVKINTYNSAVLTDLIPNTTTHIIDGGVTVANVMTDSIHITTKVLETMSFSVGTRNRDTVALNCAGFDPQDPDATPSLRDAGCEDGTGAGQNTAAHGTCDPIQQVNGNRLQLGNPDAEYSLETDKAWDVYSFWRLSSNSSGGATVYYSGNTLANTVGDEIAEIGATANASTRGTEQFGLAFVPASGAGSGQTMDSAFATLVTNNTRYSNPTLEYLAPEPAYANGVGDINATSSAAFAFVKSSNTVPAVIATNTDHVISCDTAQMRYIANIGADTPAGVYTTKINYLAAPQYSDLILDENYKRRIKTDPHLGRFLFLPLRIMLIL